MSTFCRWVKCCSNVFSGVEKCFEVDGGDGTESWKKHKMKERKWKHHADCELYNIHLWRSFKLFNRRSLGNGGRREKRLWNSQILSTYQASLFALITREYNCGGLRMCHKHNFKIQNGRRVGEECFCCWASPEWQWLERMKRKKEKKADNNADKRKYPQACWRWKMAEDATCTASLLLN